MAFKIFLVLFLVLNTLRIFEAADMEYDSDPDTRWENFKKKYQKAYSAEEEETRRNNFEENYKKILEHNQEYEQGMHSFYLGINKFADMLIEEFSSTMNGLAVDAEAVDMEGSIPLTLPDCDVPDEVDWRDESAVTPVKNQEQCQSCYSFAATGALEGQHKLKYGKLVSLSEQNIVDCSQAEGNHGCNRGTTEGSFLYVIKNGGIDSEKSYPYKAKDGKCRYKRKYAATRCSGFSQLPRGNETALQIACACVGPIAAAVDAHSDSFKHYKGGVYNSPDCSTHVTHAILVVGYGSEDGQDYWLIKNSWSTDWGEDGYGKIARNEDNMCGIAIRGSYPVL